MHPFLDVVEGNARRAAARLAVADQSLMLEYAALKAAASGLASRLAEQARSERVGIMLPTSSAAAAAILACWYAGKTPTPLNFLLAPDELHAVIRDADLDLVLTIERFAPGVTSAGVTPLLVSAKTLAPASCAPPPARGGDLAVILYTSGTAAVPKGVCLSFDNLVSNVSAAVEHARLSSEQVFLSVLPQFHSFGFTALTLAPLWLGATTWYLPRFTPLSVVHGIQERRASVFMGVASMYAPLAALRDASADALQSLELAISGGEPLAASVSAAFEARFGIRIMEGYGLTETSPIVSLNTPHAYRAASVGRPLPGVEVWAADADGQRLSAGGEGELMVRGPGVMLGYRNRPDETVDVLRGGALRTGDIGKVDADGFVHITGRAKEMIIVAGENVFPREIESVLAEHPAVAEAAVIGVRDALRGEHPIAFVILREGASAAPLELRAWCRERLAAYKAPREVRIETDLPRGPTGKILKRALRA